MSDIPPRRPFLDRLLTRRQLLVETAAAGATTVLFGGCTTNQQPTPRPTEKIPTLKPLVPTPESKALPPLAEIDIQNAARIGLSDFNTVLGLSIPENEILPNISLIRTLPEYQRIILAESPTYVPQDENDRPGITTNPNSPNGRKIYLFAPAINQMTRFLSNTEQGRQHRINVIAWILSHEFDHYTAATYQSQTLQNEVFGKIYANIPALRGKKIDPEAVRGAKVFATVEGRPINAFDNVEEAEVYLTNDMITRRHGRLLTGSLPQLDQSGFSQQINLVKRFIQPLDANEDEALKKLAQLRREPGGREKLCRQVAQFHDVPESDQLFFSLSLHYAIEIGDPTLFQNIISRAPRSKSP